MTEKIIGYILLAVGILAMLIPAINVFQVFTGGAKPIEIFHFPGVSMDLSSMITANIPNNPALKQIPSMKTEILPADMINQSANLFAHVFLMGFIINLGYRLASLGIQLLRPIKVVQK